MVHRVQRRQDVVFLPTGTDAMPRETMPTGKMGRSRVGAPWQEQ